MTKFYRVTYDCGCYFSSNLIDADRVEDATKYAGAHAAKFGYTVLKLTEISEAERMSESLKGMPVSSLLTVREFCEGLTDIDGDPVQAEEETETSEPDEQTETRTENQPENLRSNCRAALDNIRSYIMHNLDVSGYDIQPPETWHDAALAIWDAFKSETRYFLDLNEQRRFYAWCQGLPSILDTCYYYNRSAVDDLAEILHTSADRLAKYRKQGERAEREAESMLTWLIFREVSKEANK